MTIAKKSTVRKISIGKTFLAKLKKDKIEFLSFYFTSVLGKFYPKLKDPDFLVNEWYKKLSKTLSPKTIKNVRNNVGTNIPSATKYSNKPTKISGQKQIIKPNYEFTNWYIHWFTRTMRYGTIWWFIYKMIQRY